MQDLTALACGDFLSALAGPAAAPGGGGVSALAGALGVALGNMVGSLTVGKPKYAAVEPEIRALNSQAESLRCQLEVLIQADAEAFAPVAAAYRMPRATPEQAAEKAAALEAALAGACAVPMQVMELSAQGIALAEQYAAKGSVLAVSDAGCAAVLCQTALRCGLLNLYANTKLMTDRSRAKELNVQAETLLTAWTGRADRLWRQTAKDLGGEGECLSC